MSIRGRIIIGIALVGVVFALAFVTREPRNSQPPPAPAERTRAELELRDGRLHELESETPFAGLLVENYPGGQRKIEVTIEEGRPHGFSRGWYDNGQLEVEETFVEGVSHGPRTRWHRNGQKRSQATIVAGEIHGPFTKWHENGQKAAEASIVRGKPDGISRGWYPSGNPKSQVELSDGEIVSREYWEDESQ